MYDDMKEHKPGSGDTAREVRRWLNEIDSARKHRESWEKRAQESIDRYEDERMDLGPDSEARKFNMLWSNIQTLLPSLYSRKPEPFVQRKHNDQDPVARMASMVLQRAVSAQLDLYDFNSTIELAVLDMLLTGMGTVWTRFVPEFETVTLQEEGPGVDADGNPTYESIEIEQEILADAYVTCDYVSWRNFVYSPAATWDKVRWVARREWMDKDELSERFGEDIAERLCARSGAKDDDDNGMLHYDSFKEENGKAYEAVCVYEIWDKSKKQVIWVSPDWHEEFLDRQDDPLNLDGFFPCPRPMFATLKNNTLVPIPDYYLYKDQAAEIDRLTMRIAYLSNALKVVGGYDGSIPELGNILDRGVENQLVPVENYAAFSQQGGMQGAISLMPIQEIAMVLNQLYADRAQAKNDLYEITGISDIIRGSSDASETATAQRIKGQFGTMRLQSRQADVARFIRDIIRIKAEIVAEQFNDEILAKVSGAQFMPDFNPMVFPQAVQLLKDETAREFRVDIETDSTIQPDEQADKESRLEFLNAVMPFMQQAIEMARGAPDAAPLIGDVLLFAVRGFKVGRALETSIEQAVEGMKQAAQQAMQQPPQPDPAQIEAQKKLEIDQMKAEGDLAIKGQKVQGDLALQAQKQKGELALDQQEQLLKTQFGNYYE